jgi:hypothetical protein
LVGLASRLPHMMTRVAVDHLSRWQQRSPFAKGTHKRRSAKSESERRALRMHARAGSPIGHDERSSGIVLEVDESQGTSASAADAVDPDADAAAGPTEASSASTAKEFLRAPKWLRRCRRILRVEELLLVWAWLVCIALIFYADVGGPDLRLVFSRYFSFFGTYILVVFTLSRIAFLLGDRYRPQAAWRTRIVSWFVGPLPGFEPKRLERWVFRNVRESTARPRPASLDVDIEFLRGLLLLFASLTIYTNIKTRIPFINHGHYDASYEAMDHALFGSTLVRSVEQWFSGNPAVSQYFSGVYMHDYLWMVVILCVFYFRRDIFAIRWTFLSVSFVYIFGILVTVAWPSLGPVYVHPERFVSLKGSIVGDTQAFLAAYYNASISAVAHGKAPVARAFAGIAAFPSLHVAHMVIILWIALRTIPAYAIWMAWMTVATTLATVGFGWHWMVDAPGGALLAIAIAEALYRLMRHWDRQRETTLAS